MTLCGIFFWRLSDGELVICGLEKGHCCAHAWEPKTCKPRENAS